MVAYVQANPSANPNDTSVIADWVRGHQGRLLPSARRALPTTLLPASLCPRPPPPLSPHPPAAAASAHRCRRPRPLQRA